MENSRKPVLLVTYRNQVFLYFHSSINTKKKKKKKKKKNKKKKKL